MSIRTAKIEALLNEVASIVEGGGTVFRPSVYGHVFSRWTSLREELLSEHEDIFGGLPSSPEQTARPSAEFDGEGQFDLHQFRALRRELAHAHTLSLALDANPTPKVTGVRVVWVGTARPLSVKTIGKLRGILGALSRASLHQALIEAGSQEALSMQYTESMGDPHYRSKAVMLSEGFDPPARDSDGGTGFLLELVRVLSRSHSGAAAIRQSGLDSALAADGFSMQDVLGHETPAGSDAVESFARELGAEALALHRKTWGRVESDPSGAITAATSMAESIIRGAMAKLQIDPSGADQLPDLVVRLTRTSNLDEVLRESRGHGLMKAIRGVGHAAYSLANDAGDRHGGTRDVLAERETAYVFASSMELLCGVIARGIRSGRLQRREEAERQS